jgi:hypothetical protein
MRGKLGTGKHLNETHVLLPQNVPAAGGVATPGDGAQPPIFTGGDNAGTGATGDMPPASPTGGGGDQIPTGGIFDGGGQYVPLDIPSTSALNLLGKIETHGITPGSQLRQLNLRVDKLTGAQLQEIIKKLPDGMTYELGVEKEQTS